jgi:DNA-binding NtrC family response regulator
MTVERELTVQWVRDRVDNSRIIELYVGRRLPMQKTADMLGISKSQVLERLRKLGLQRGRYD